MLTSSSHPISGPRESTRRSGTARPNGARRRGRRDRGRAGTGAVGHRAPVQRRRVRFEAPETISGRARCEDVPRGGSDPDQHLRDMLERGGRRSALPFAGACSTSGLPTRRSCRRSFAPTTIISTFETLPSKDVKAQCRYQSVNGRFVGTKAVRTRPARRRASHHPRVAIRKASPLFTASVVPARVARASTLVKTSTYSTLGLSHPSSVCTPRCARTARCP